ncbi:MAG: DUF5317 domain-containing protein [Chloroflexi bacterium]|nr:DUF5317 domain-containing protein [Chloroflexota bacterium]
MVLVLAIAAAIICGCLRGLDPSRLSRLPLRAGWLALGALIVQMGFFLLVTPEGLSGWPAAMAVTMITYGLLAVFLWLNRCLPGMKVIALGLLLNLAVITANGGYMPVSPEALALKEGRVPSAEDYGRRPSRSKDVVLDRSETRLWLLSDIFVIPKPLPFTSVLSIGDLFLAAGAFIVVYRQMLSPMENSPRGLRSRSSAFKHLL